MGPFREGSKQQHLTSQVLLDQQISINWLLGVICRCLVVLGIVFSTVSAQKRDGNLTHSGAPPLVPLYSARWIVNARRKDIGDGNDEDDGPSSDSTDGPLPRPKRSRRRSTEDRGLATDEELSKLAAAYLDRQRKLWPQLVNAGLLPERSRAV